MSARREKIGRPLCCGAVFGVCFAALLILLVCSGVYSEEVPHLEHRCFTMEDFLDGLLPHERLLFQLGGHDAVEWGYILACCGVIALGFFLCRLVLRARPTPESGPSADRRPDLTAQGSSAAGLTEQR